MINATVSHEMRTPINAMLTQLRTLFYLFKGNKQGQQMVKIIINSAELLLFLVNDMLDVYMLKNGKLQPIYQRVNFKNLIEEIMQMFSIQIKARDLEFIYILSDKVP